MMVRAAIAEQPGFVVDDRELQREGPSYMVETLNKYAQADKAFRAALPHLKSDSRLYATALFHLGWANYKLGVFADAIRFTQDCSRIKSPFQEQAIKNLGVFRAESQAAKP